MAREEEIFAEIYEKKLWDPHRNGEALSGWGSTFKNSELYIQFLQLFFRMNRITSVLDVGCGNWSFSQYIQWGNIQYVGIDVVKSVIEENRKKFSSSTISFVHANALQVDLPSADLLLCKDVLMHLPNRDIQILLTKFEKFKHCLITNVLSDKPNRDIETGGFRGLDLTEPPFHLSGLKMFTYYTDHCMKQVVIYARNQ